MLAYYKFDTPCTDPVEEIDRDPTASLDAPPLEQFGRRSFATVNTLSELRDYSFEKLPSYNASIPTETVYKG
jgi:hypothetical protein